MAQQTLNHEQGTQDIHKKYDYIYRYLRGFVLVIFGIWLGSIFFSDAEGYATNVFTELIGIIATYLIFDEISKRSAKRELRDELLADLKSTSVSPAVNALDRLRRENWLDDDYFTDSDLQRANWEGAYIGGLNFENADMRGINLKNVTAYKQYKIAIFTGTNLQDAQFTDSGLFLAHFQGARLYKAQLQNTCLEMTQFEGARLCLAQLQGANLNRAHLENADLRGVQLKGAKLAFAHLDNVRWARDDGQYPATLPDGTTWSPEENMERFTNPEHPKFNATLEKINAIRVTQGYEPIEI